MSTLMMVKQPKPTQEALAQGTISTASQLSIASDLQESQSKKPEALNETKKRRKKYDSMPQPERHDYDLRPRKSEVHYADRRPRFKADKKSVEVK